MDLPAIEQITPARRGAIDAWSDGDGWLAGGTSLFSEPQPALRRLHDLAALGWPALTERPDGLEIAATCTLAELAAYRPPADWPAARLGGECAEALLGSFKVWNAATVGGNLCLALPAGPMVALAVALDARLEIWSAGGHARTLAALEFVTGPGETVLAPGELLRSILLPAARLRETVALRRASLAPVGRSAALVIGRREDSGAVTVTITAAVPRPAQLRFAAPPDAAQLRAALSAAALQAHDDPHGDPRWRTQLIGLLCEQVRAELESCR